jgi:hypothetical protein
VKVHGQGKRSKQPDVSTLGLIAARMSSKPTGASKSTGTSKSTKSANSAGTSKPVGSSKPSHKRNDVRDRQTSHKDDTRRDSHNPKPRALSQAVRRAKIVWADRDDDMDDNDESEDDDDDDDDDDDRRRSPHSRKSGSRKSGKRMRDEQVNTPRRQVTIYDYRTASQITKQSPHARKMKGDAKRWYRFWILIVNAFPAKPEQLEAIKGFFRRATEAHPEHYAVSQ